MISHSKKFIFVHPHRTGGSSMDMSLKRYSDHPVKYRQKYGVSHLDYKHERIPDFIENGLITEEEYHEFYKFCTVRNPWERAISWYFWRLKINKDPHINRLIENKGNVFDKETFIDICEDKRYQIPPLSEDIVDINGEFNVDIYDTIIRMESIDKDFKRVCMDLNISNYKVFPYCKPPYGGTNHKYYTEYYDDDMIEVVNKIYGDDIRELKYKYGD